MLIIVLIVTLQPFNSVNSAMWQINSIFIYLFIFKTSKVHLISTQGTTNLVITSPFVPLCLSEHPNTVQTLYHPFQGSGKLFSMQHIRVLFHTGNTVAAVKNIVPKKYWCRHT